MIQSEVIKLKSCEELKSLSLKENRVIKQGSYEYRKGVRYSFDSDLREYILDVPYNSDYEPTTEEWLELSQDDYGYED